MRLGITKLRTQILLFALSLILVSTLVIQSISWWSANKFNQHQIQQNTIKAENILRQYIRSNENNLVNSARVLTADFGFKQGDLQIGKMLQFIQCGLIQLETKQTKRYCSGGHHGQQD